MVLSTAPAIFASHRVSLTDYKLSILLVLGMKFINLHYTDDDFVAVCTLTLILRHLFLALVVLNTTGFSSSWLYGLGKSVLAPASNTFPPLLVLRFARLSVLL